MARPLAIAIAMSPGLIAITVAIPIAPIPITITIALDDDRAVALRTAGLDQLSGDGVIAATIASDLRLHPRTILVGGADDARALRPFDPYGRGRAIAALNANPFGTLRALGTLGPFGTLGFRRSIAFAVIRLGRLVAAITASAIMILSQRRHRRRADQKKG